MFCSDVIAKGVAERDRSRIEPCFFEEHIPASLANLSVEIQREARLAVLDQALARGIEDAEAGRAKPLADVVARLERKYGGEGLRSDFECS
jgi:predicted transcriptional regulator